MIGASTKDVIECFYGYNNATPLQRKSLDEGFLVPSKVRKEILLGELQGKLTVCGKVCKFNFDNLGDGVWRVTLEV